MTTRPATRHRSEPALAQLDLNRLARVVVGIALLASGGLLFHLTRGSSFWADDWSWITTRRGNDLAAFLAPYNGHLSLVPVAIYRLLFATFGIGTYTPYRVVVIVLSLVVAALVFAYGRSRTSEGIAAAAAAAMLFLGPGWQDTMWAFQIPWLIVCAAGIGALMLVERRTRRGDAAACTLIAIAIASTSLAIAFALGIAVEITLRRRRWRDAWIWAGPLLLYAIWVLAYHPGQADLRQVSTIPLAIAGAAATALGALAGLSGSVPFAENTTSLVYGWPLLAIGALLALRRSDRLRGQVRVLSLVIIFVVFVASVSIAHDGLSSPEASRYVYVYCLLAVLLATELLRGVQPPATAQLTLYAVVAVTIVANIGVLRAFGAYIRTSGATTNGALTALSLDRAHVPRTAVARIALWQFVTMRAGAYFDAERSLGSPAYTVPQLRHADSTAQSAADAQQLADADVALTSRRPSTAGTAPAVLSAQDGTVRRTGSCARLVPAAAIPPGGSAVMSVPIGPGGLTITAPKARASLSVRRFAPTFTPLGSVAGHGAGSVTVVPDAAHDRWLLQVSSLGPVQACTARP